MKKLSAIVVLVLAIMVLSAVPAYAATLRVTSARVTAATVAPATFRFSGALSRPASRVDVLIYRGRSVMRRISARLAGTAYTAVWDGKDAAGRTVTAGSYAYRITAVSTSTRAARRGRVTVTAPAPAPAPAPVPAPTPAPVPASGRWIGFFQQGVPTTMDALTTLENNVGVQAAVVNFYVTDTEGFPVNRAKAVAAHGSIPMITLEFWSTKTGGVDTITNGSKDAALIAFADAAKAHGTEIWLRPLHEMNSNWYPWAGGTNGNTAAKVVAAWKHIKDVFTSRGATNVKFVWCVNAESVPNTTANAISAYWPGDAYVDKMSIDGYNFGTSASWSTWRSFTSVYSSSYAKLTALSAKPLFVAEVACAEQGGSKAAWITDMFKVIPTSFPRIQGVCWFNSNDLTSTNTDWRVNSSTTSLAAFRAGATAGF